jgi:hypothetical protein
MRRRLTSKDESVQLAAARQWTRWEMATSRLFPDLASINKADDDKVGACVCVCQQGPRPSVRMGTRDTTPRASPRE